MVVTTSAPVAMDNRNMCSALPAAEVECCCTHMSRSDSRSVTKAAVAYSLTCAALMLSKQRLAWHLQHD